jgi:hypothetical protein
VEPPLRRFPPLLSLCLSACTFTVVKDTWRAPGVSLAPLNRVVVLSATGSASRRKDQNAAIAAVLRTRGVITRVGSEALPASLYDKDGDGRVDPKVDPAAIRQALRSQGETYALVVRSLNARRPAAPAVLSPTAGGELQAAVLESAAPDLTPSAVAATPTAAVNPDRIIDLALYDLLTGQKVWTAVTSTEAPQGRADLLNALSRAVFSALDRDGLLPAADY